MQKEKIKKEKSSLATECDRVGEIAVQYGFTVIKPPHITSDDISTSKQFKDFDYYYDVEEKNALTGWYIDKKLESGAQPILLHYKKPLLGSSTKKKPYQSMYGFEVMGS